MRASVLSRGAACKRLGLAGLGWSQARGHQGPVSLARTLTTARVRSETFTGPGSPKVVILGGGFGGLYTAVRLCSLFWPRGKQPQVTLVDQNERFVFKPLLYELVSNTASEMEVAPTYSQLLAPYPVRFLQAKAVAAEPEQLLRDGGSTGGGVVKLDGGQQLEYDWLVVALGAQADARGVPGVKEHAIAFNTLEDALRVRDALASIEQAASLAAPGYGSRGHTVMVVGAGYAGVELACVVAERLRNQGLAGKVQVSLVTPGHSILEGSFSGQREAAEQVLADMGITITTGTRVVSVEKPSAEQDPTLLPTTVTVNLDDSPPGSQQGAPSSSTSSSNGSSSSGMGDGPASNGVNAGSYGQPPPGLHQVTADLVLWTAGSSPVTKSARKGFPFPTNERGSVKTDATLRVLSHSRAFALGDVCVADQGYIQDTDTARASSQEGQQATSPSTSAGMTSSSAAAVGSAGGSTFPATAQVAFQQADYVAWNVWASIAGRPLLPFRYQHLGSMMSLGTFNAAVELPVSLPEPLTTSLQQSPLGPLLSTLGVKLNSAAAANAAVPGGVTLEGPLAALIRRAAYLYRQPTTEQRLSVAAEWASQAANIAQSAAALLQQQPRQKA